MYESLNLYWQTLLHPWDESSRSRKISFLEVLGISWALHFVYTFYSVFALFLGIKTYEYFSTSGDFTHLILDSLSFSLQKISLFVQLGTAILYPVMFYFTYKFWIYLLNFYTEIFDSKAENENNISDVVTALYTSNLFLVLPIVGAFFSFLAQVYLLYRGVIKKLDFSKTQAILVLMTPLFLLFIFTVLIVSYFVFLVSLI